MSNNYYNHSNPFAPKTKVRSAEANAKFDSVAAGFDKLPVPHATEKGFLDPIHVGNATQNTQAPTLAQVQGWINTWLTNVSAAGFRLSDLPNPVNNQDPVTLAFLLARSLSYFQAPTAPLSLGNQRATNAASPEAGTDLANRNYVDTRTLNHFPVPTAPLSLGGQRATNAASPQDGTDLTTRAYVDALAMEVSGGSLPNQAGNAGKVIGTDGAVADWKDPAAYMPQAIAALIDKGSNATPGATVDFDVSASAKQKLTIAANTVIAFSGWPAGAFYAEIDIQLVNAGAAVITWPTINWLVGDGSTSQAFNDMGVTLAASGTNTVLVWSGDGGATLYGRAA